jgi:hypothetical protein
MHQPIPEQGRWLARVVRGYFAYYAVPTNRASISAFRRYAAPRVKRRKDAMSRTKAAVVFQQSPSSKSLLDVKEIPANGSSN